MTNTRVIWLSATDPPDAFPPVEQALREPDGLLAAGGDLSTARLLAAYRRGIFPWYEAGQPLLWWSPDPRCVFLPGDFHVARSLARYLRHSNAEVHFNSDFDAVIRACAAPRRYENHTWITAEMYTAYTALHEAGWAHSIEIRDAGELVGGMYGIVIGRAFFGESMFSRQTNASKIALLAVARLMDDGVLGLLDCQLQSPHLTGLGASIIPRSNFTARLDVLCEPPERFRGWPGAPLRVPDLAG